MAKKRIVLHFPTHISDQPLVYKLARDYALEFNILKAQITEEEGGLLVLEVSGEKRNMNKGIQYLKDAGVQVQPLSQDIVRDEKRCSHCSSCITVCPAGAFEVHPATREVFFKDEQCVACGACIKTCPLHAMEMRL